MISLCAVPRLAWAGREQRVQTGWVLSAPWQGRPGCQGGPHHPGRVWWGQGLPWFLSRGPVFLLVSWEGSGQACVQSRIWGSSSCEVAEPPLRSAGAVQAPGLGWGQVAVCPAWVGCGWDRSLPTLRRLLPVGEREPHSLSAPCGLPAACTSVPGPPPCSSGGLPAWLICRDPSCIALR